MKIISLEMKLEMRDLIFRRISQHLLLDAVIESDWQESSRSLNVALVISRFHKRSQRSLLWWQYLNTVAK